MQGAEKFIQDVTREAGEVVLKRFGKDGVHYAKSGHAWDVVTKADLASEKLIISRIKKRYPDHGIIAEESGTFNEDAEYVWIIDPIDGTMNFSRGVPLFGVMLCLVRRGKVILSAIYLPAVGEFYFARARGGAYLNGKPIHCSSFKQLHESVGCSSSTLRARTAAFLRKVLALNTKKNIHLMSFGAMSVAACYVAAGRRDWLISFAGSVWDFAPAYLMLKESGCKVTDGKGGKWVFGGSEFVAANPALHKQLLKLTKGL